MESFPCWERFSAKTGGHLTDLEENADSAAAQALYEGQIAANLLGRAHFHIKKSPLKKSVKPTNSFMTIPTA